MYSEHLALFAINIATLFQILFTPYLRVAVLLQMLEYRVTQRDKLVIFPNKHVLDFIGVGWIY